MSFFFLADLAVSYKKIKIELQNKDLGQMKDHPPTILDKILSRKRYVFALIFGTLVVLYLFPADTNNVVQTVVTPTCNWRPEPLAGICDVTKSTVESKVTQHFVCSEELKDVVPQDYCFFLIISTKNYTGWEHWRQRGCLRTKFMNLELFQNLCPILSIYSNQKSFEMIRNLHNDKVHFWSFQMIVISLSYDSYITI